METKSKALLIFTGIILACIAGVGTYLWYINDNSTSKKDDDDDNDDIINHPQLNTRYCYLDHKCLNFSKIPDEWIDIVQDISKLHYAHTSHGGQITTGLSRLETVDSTYSQARASNSLPTEAGALCIYDGNGISGNTYITPDLYWEDPTGIGYTYNVIDNNPSLNISMWCWCTQVSYYSESAIQTYLQQMDDFEQHYINEGRNVRFVYMTGNADDGDYPEGTPAEASNQDPASGYHRYVNNEIIRNFCKKNNKTLFDFADIECWLYYSNGTAYDYATYDYYNGTDWVTVPKRHWNYSSVSQAAHTSYENCENKAKALWWMLAQLEGWDVE
ncbi:MAG: hypothetical protein ACFFAO_11990 [Candidatus Hermodarchaeota archaeon]